MPDEPTTATAESAEPPTRAPKAKFVAPGQYFDGIPARDLSKDEYDALPAEQRQLVDHSGLWEISGKKSTPVPAAPGEGE